MPGPIFRVLDHLIGVLTGISVESEKASRGSRDADDSEDALAGGR